MIGSGSTGEYSVGESGSLFEEGEEDEVIIEYYYLMLLQGGTE